MRYEASLESNKYIQIKKEILQNNTCRIWIVIYIIMKKKLYTWQHMLF